MYRSRRTIYEHTPQLLLFWRNIVLYGYPVWHICYMETCITIRVRYFHATCHHTTSVERSAGRIGKRIPVNNEKIVVKTLCKRVGNTTPFAISIMYEVVFTTQIDLYFWASGAFILNSIRLPGKKRGYVALWTLSSLRLPGSVDSSV